MAYTLNGVSYESPTTGQRSWGANATAILDALGAYTITVDGGTRSLLSELNLGASYGIKVAVVKTQDAAPAAAGVVRMGNTEVVGWRNAADDGDLALTSSASDRLTYGGVNVMTISSTDILSNKTLTLPQINDTSSDHQYVFAVSELAADMTVTLPALSGSDQFTFDDHQTTLTNKTLTAPEITAGSTLLLNTQAELRLEDDSGTEYVGIVAPDSVTTWKFSPPPAAPTVSLSLIHI